MRNILYITLVILFLLPCARVFAGEDALPSSETLKFAGNEEFRADWESEENARIMGESVVSSFRNGDVTGIKLNALCSSGSIEEISRLRKWFKSLIESEKKSGRITEQSLLAAEILEKIAEYDITGLSGGEERLINSVKSSPLSAEAVKPGSLADNSIPDEEIALIIPVTAINSSSKTIHFKSVLSNRYRSSIISSKTPGRNFETAHADYYRLFLYMRDDTGDSASIKTVYYSSLHFSQLFTSSISSSHNNEHQPESDHRKENVFLSSITCADHTFILHFYHNHHGGLS